MLWADGIPTIVVVQFSANLVLLIYTGGLVEIFSLDALPDTTLAENWHRKTQTRAPIEAVV